MSRGRLGEFASPWAGNTHSLTARKFSTECRTLALQTDPLSEAFRYTFIHHQQVHQGPPPNRSLNRTPVQGFRLRRGLPSMLILAVSNKRASRLGDLSLRKDVLLPCQLCLERVGAEATVRRLLTPHLAMLR